MYLTFAFHLEVLESVPPTRRCAVPCDFRTNVVFQIIKDARMAIFTVPGVIIISRFYKNRRVSLDRLDLLRKFNQFCDIEPYY